MTHLSSHLMTGRSRCRSPLVALLAGLFATGAGIGLAFPATAHDGPPYPIIVDRPTGPIMLSVWADPDVGTGTYHVYLEPLAEDRPLPTGCDVEIFVQPTSGRLAEKGHRAEPIRIDEDRHHYLGEVQFDAQESWRTRIAVGCGAAGAGEADTVVEVTPPGQGPVLDFILYLFPFVAVGALLVRALVVGRRQPKRPG